MGLGCTEGHHDTFSPYAWISWCLSQEKGAELPCEEPYSKSFFGTPIPSTNHTMCSLPMLPVTTSPRAGHPPGTAIQRKCSRDNMMFIENLQGATASAEESLVCVILIFSVKDLTGLQTRGPSFLIGCTSACGSGGKFPKTSKFELELTIPCLPSLDYGPRSFQKIQDEEFGAFIFSSITVHNVYHEGETLRGNGVEACCV